MSKAVQKRRHDLDIVIGSGRGDSVQVLSTTDGTRSDVDSLVDIPELLDIQVERADTSKFADKHMLMSKIKVAGTGIFNKLIKRHIGQQLLPTMVAREDVTGVKELLECKVNVNASQNEKQGSALHVAVTTGNLNLAKMLIKSGAEVNNQMNMFGQSPLHKAADSSMLQLLLDSGADAELPDAKGVRGPKLMATLAPAQEKKEPVAAAPLPVAQEPEATALTDATNQLRVQPDGTGYIYDDYLTLLASEKPITMKVPMKFGGAIRLPRKAVLKSIYGKLEE
jgi:hypothetical protein